ncbi:MAG: carboxypeptidase regulatory-like domain-containing protein [Dehalococcoidales bacterium]|nr:carboxypeptidase regulatory-like domain-containing protein [Dehalococcoidales bacterium]
MKVFVIDVGICNGCYACQIACKDEHVGNDWSPYAKPQPDTGQFWMKLNEYIRGTVPKVKMHYIPVLCQHCDKAPCIPACPVKGAIYKRDDGLVIIDAEKCTGCKACVDACPYGAIYFNDSLNIAQKCTGCAHLLDGGEWKVPRCADACPTEAIKFGEESEFKGMIAKAEVLKPELKTKPRVYYLNIPKKFIAGTVYDPIEKEVVIGAKCTLTGPKAGKTTMVTTDSFGDFWFHGLADGNYNLTIEAKGFAAKSFKKLNTEKDVNLGDIPLGKAKKR